MNASCGSELTKFILKHSLERCHQSKPLPGAVKRFFFFCLPPPANMCGCAITTAISGPPHLLPLQRRLSLLLISLPTPLGSIFNMHSTLQPPFNHLLIHHTHQGSCLADRHQIFIKRRRRTDRSVWLCSVMGDTVSMNSVLPAVKADLQRTNLAKALRVNERVKKGGKHFHFH